MSSFADWIAARTTHTVRGLVRRWENIRQRDSSVINLYRLVRTGAELPEGITLRSRVTGLKPTSTLRFAASDETFRGGTWKKMPRNPYEQEFIGDWVIDARDVTVAAHGETRLPDGRWLQFPFLNIHKPLGHTTEGVVQHITEPVWIIQNGTDAFGHWLLHVLPRIHLARMLDPHRKILTKHPGWNPAGVLAMEGLTVDDVLWFPEDSVQGGYVQVDDGSFVSHAVPRGNVNLYPLFTDRFDPFVRDYLAKASPKSPVGKRLYVSRSTRDVAQNRDGCVNRVELEEFFAARGFEVVFPERYPFADQVAMFRDAEFIIAEGGSAPHLALFSPPETKLVYISAELAANNNHWQRRIADFRTLHYRHIIPTRSTSQRKYIANMDEVRLAVETLPWQ